MARLAWALACAALVLSGQSGVDRSKVAEVLGFEGESAGGGAPRGWMGGPSGTLFSDNVVVHGGQRSLRIERTAGSAQQFSTATLMVPIDFAGGTIEMRGFVRTEGVSEWVGLWMREDGDTPGLAFDNMRARGPAGTTGWKEYSIRLPLHPKAKRLYFGVLLAGTGKAWADDLQLLVDGKPIAEAKAAERPKTVLDTDREFDGGSRIVVTELTEAQRTNLATLGKVWGFLKYHHPRVTRGELHWDYELFRVMPKVLGARATADIGEGRPGGGVAEDDSAMRDCLSFEATSCPQGHSARRSS